MTSNQVVNVTEFKAKCLALFDEVEAGKLSITVTRRGKVIGVVSPPPIDRTFKSSRGSWAGKMEIVGDIVNLDTSDLWDVVNGRQWPEGGSSEPLPDGKSARAARI